MKTELKDVIHLYIGAEFIFENENVGKICGVHSDMIYNEDADESGEGLFYLPDCRPILRRISNMTETELFDICFVAFNSDDLKGEDKLTKKEFHCEIALRGKTFIEAEITCRCFEGGISITNNGSISLMDDSREFQPLGSESKSFLWLLKNGFDLFGLIDFNQAIDAKTLEP